MLKYKLQVLFFLVLGWLLLFIPNAFAGDTIKGIYITQSSLENTKYINYLIKNAKAAGIDTFVIDLEKPSTRYKNNIALVKDNHIRYVARVIIFPDGGSPYAIKDSEFWQRKYTLVKQAIDWGADEIQLDYIRYNTKQKPSAENAKNINTIIQWYKNKLSGQNIPLQVDVFGIASFGDSKHIGQNIQLFSQNVDAICPMVYPSHYEPFAYHYKIPFETVYDSLSRIKKQFNNEMPIKMYPYIELSNYHYPRMSHQQKLVYIKEQLRAVEKAQADGWFAWSPHNKYENLFYVLQHRDDDQSKPADQPAKQIDQTANNQNASVPSSTSASTSVTTTE